MKRAKRMYVMTEQIELVYKQMNTITNSAGPFAFAEVFGYSVSKVAELKKRARFVRAWWI